MTGIAYQYALAVFSLADEAKRSQSFNQELAKFSSSLDEKTYRFFAHPKISKQEKMDILEKTVQDDSLLLNFLKVLVENDRFDLIEAIIVSYQSILDDLDKVMVVKVISNKALSKENLEKIKVKLNQKYKRNIKIEKAIDPNIIGGFRIEFEGNVIDETINRQLDQMKSSLLE